MIVFVFNFFFIPNTLKLQFIDLDSTSCDIENIVFELKQMSHNSKRVCLQWFIGVTISSSLASF